MQASEMRFLQIIDEVTLFNKVRSSEIQKSPNIEPLLLQIKRSQLRCVGHVSRVPQERLPKQALFAKANGRRPVGRPRSRWSNYIKDLGRNRFGLHSSEMVDVTEDREVWRLNLEQFSPNPHVKAGNDERRKRKKMIFICCQTLFLIYSLQLTKNITIYVAKCFEFFSRFGLGL